MMNVEALYTINNTGLIPPRREYNRIGFIFIYITQKSLDITLMHMYTYSILSFCKLVQF